MEYYHYEVIATDCSENNDAFDIDWGDGTVESA